MRVTIELLPDATAPVGNQPKRIAISELPVIGPILRGRWFQWAITVVTLAVFLVVILTGLFGTPAGNHNFGIIYVWLVWWAVLKLVLIPFLGRFWCSICPIPAPGDWIQRRSMLTPRPGGKLYTYATGLFRKVGQARRSPVAQVPAQHLGAELRVPGHRALLRADPDQPARHRHHPDPVHPGLASRQPVLRAQVVLPLPVPHRRLRRRVRPGGAGRDTRQRPGRVRDPHAEELLCRERRGLRLPVLQPAAEARNERLVQHVRRVPAHVRPR